MKQNCFLCILSVLFHFFLSLFIHSFNEHFISIKLHCDRHCPKKRWVLSFPQGLHIELLEKYSAHACLCALESTLHPDGQISVGLRLGKREKRGIEPLLASLAGRLDVGCKVSNSVLWPQIPKQHRTTVWWTSRKEPTREDGEPEEV